MTISHIKEHNSKELRQCQLVELGILTEIDRICAKYDIEYWLDGGTLLGAVRHSGFIPWDDDIDIAMSRSDVARFIAVAKKDLKEEYFLQTPETDPSSPLGFIKVRHNGSFILGKGDDVSSSYHRGLNVDIFAMEPFPDMSANLCKKITRGYCLSNAILKTKHYYSLRSFVEFFYFGIKKIICLSIWKVLRVIRPRNTYFGNRIEENGYGIQHKIADIFPLSKIQFEGCTFSAPHNPDGYLRDLYRNYLELPPEDKRTSHAEFLIHELSK